MYMKIGLTALFLIGALSSLIYSLILLAKFLTKRLGKREAMKKTFWVTFCGWMSMFLGYFIWQADWDIKHWLVFLAVSTSISFIGAISFTASFWTSKE